MATVELTQDNFNEVVGGDGLVLVDFWAEWCGPCKMFGPVFEKSSEQHGDITFGKVDTEAQGELAQAFQISSIPTLMAVRDGVVLYSQAGALPAASLEDLIGQLRAVDMEEVKAQIAAHEAEHGSEPHTH
ncbi:thioredoxin [Kribbella sp. NPDC058693]|uniref:Thioredoxin n=1 Tax=Kribbella jiaozuonensis TaxID=2575441 RepID=A0A4U3M778_9ACTN|nr:thioredoxin [Kribbella jiaozuonensis]TKK79236.1 thioredoxin [Kribbella jiaozuonensis]TKK83306.1 thioredoxin [Kribbella jiaozuonensis]